MADDWATPWIAEKFEHPDVVSIEITAPGILRVARKGLPVFHVAALGVEDVVTIDHVRPLITAEETPDFVVNVPSRAIWTGAAVDLVHKTPAAFGGVGDLSRATRFDPVSSYRFKEYAFVENGLRQHSAVRSMSRLYDRVFLVERRDGLPDIRVVLIDAYDMSAEDIRNARNLYGQFEAALKTSSYGSISTAAREAAESMGAGAFKWGELLRRLRNP